MWIFVDDTDEFMIYVESWNEQIKDSQMLGGSYASPQSPVQLNLDQAEKPSIAYNCDGTQIDIYGWAPSGTTLNYTLNIGSGSASPLSLVNTGSPTIKSNLIASIPVLGNGVHEVEVTVNSGNPYIDYLLVTPKSSSEFVSRMLLADDRDPYFKYSGSWTQDSGPSTDYGTSLNNTRTGSKTKGDKATVTFFGDSIAVFGLLNPTDGTLSASFSVDGNTPTVYTPFNGSQTVNSSQWLINQQFFYQEFSTTSKAHTLTVNVEQVTGSQALWLDYVTFEGNAFTQLNPPTAADTADPDAVPKSVSLAWLPGVIVGGIAVLVAIVIMFCVFRGCRSGRTGLLIRTNFAGNYKLSAVRPARAPAREPTPPPPFVETPPDSQAQQFVAALAALGRAERNAGNTANANPYATSLPGQHTPFPSIPSPSPSSPGIGGPGYVGGFALPSHQEQQPLLYHPPSPAIPEPSNSSAIFVTSAKGELTLVAPGTPTHDDAYAGPSSSSSFFGASGGPSTMSNVMAGHGAYPPDIKHDPSLFTQMQPSAGGSSSSQHAAQEPSVQQLQQQIEQLRWENERIRGSGQAAPCATDNNVGSGTATSRVHHGHNQSLGGTGDALPPPPYQPEF